MQKTLQENTENNSKEIDQQDETITELEENNHSNTTVVILLPSFHNTSSYPAPDAMSTFISCRGKLLKKFGSLLNTELSVSFEYALRPPTSPINSGFSLPKKEATCRRLLYLDSLDNKNILGEQKRLDPD